MGQDMRMVYKDKKGIMSFNFLAMVPRLIFLVVMLIVCVILIRMFLNEKFDVLDVQAEVLVNGMVYGTGGISYTDPVTGRIFPEIIDLTQLNDTELDSAFYFVDNKMITARISVGRQDEITRIKEVYYNKAVYDNWRPLLALKNLKGIGGVTDYEKTLPIILRDADGTLKNGDVTFQVVQPKSLRARSGEDE